MINFPPPLAGLLTIEEKRDFEYCLDDSFIGQMRTARDVFNKMPDDEKSRFVKVSAEVILTDTVFNAAVGSFLGAITGTAITLPTCNFIIIKAGSITGAKIGFFVGAMSGFCGSVVRVKTKFMSSSLWTYHKIDMKTNKLYPLYRKILNNEEEISELICGIDQDLIEDPVRSPNGHLFEKSSIEEWIRLREVRLSEARRDNYPQRNIDEIISTIDPFRGAPFTIEELRPVEDYDERLKEAAVKVLARTEDKQAKQIFSEAIACLTQAKMENRVEQATAIICKLNKYAIKHHIPLAIIAKVGEEILERAREED